MRTRVIGIGTEAAGDDAVGLEVIRALRMAPPRDVELLELADPSALVAPLLEEVPLVIVDGVLAAPAGCVTVLREDALYRAGHAFVSSHGFGVVDALHLARALADQPRRMPLFVVGIHVTSLPTPHRGLSPEVAVAVPEAAEVVRRIALDMHVRAVPIGVGHGCEQRRQ